MPTNRKTEVPAQACRLAGGEVELEAAAESGNVPIRMMARTGQPIEHWWWGRCVHDMAGMKLHKSTLPIDYVHDEPIGFLNKFEASNDGLVVEGELVPTGEPGDRTSRLLKLSGGGVPFEASIDFTGDGIKTEWLGEDQVAEVNGYTFEGPGVIIREWPLRGVAVCPYGADMHTESAFRRGGEQQTFSLHNVEATMPKNPEKKLSEAGAVAEAAPAVVTPAAEAAPVVAEETKPAEEKPAEASPADEVAALSAMRSEAKRFRESFGDKGAVWFAEGLTFDEARARELAELKADKERLSKEVGELKSKLAAAGQGEKDPVSFNADGETKRNGFAAKIRMK